MNALLEQPVVCNSKLPSYLTDLPIWGYWRMENGTKVPYVDLGRRGRTNETEGWQPFDVVKRMRNKAMLIRRKDSLTGIDLDNCFDVNGDLRSWAVEPVLVCGENGYGEISPSGRGLKFLLRGRKPNGFTSESKSFGAPDDDECDKQQQIEIFDEKRFFAITGNRYEHSLLELDGDASESQNAIDTICKRWIPKRGLPVRRDLNDWQPHVTMPAEDRASRYLDSCTKPHKGGRNKAVFKAAGGLWANCQELGEDRIHQLMQWWNSTFPEPLHEDEVRNSTRSAMVNGTLPQPKELEPDSFLSHEAIDQDEAERLSQQLGCSAPRVHVDHGLDTLEKDEAEIAAEEVASRPIPKLRYPGLINDIIEHNLETAIYPYPNLAFASAIAAISTVTGRVLCDRNEGRTNLMIIGTGPSGGGKDHARRLNKKLFADYPDILGPEKLSSAQGIPGALRKCPMMLMQLDEIGQVFASVSKSKNDNKTEIFQTLMEAYTSSGSPWNPNGRANHEYNFTINDPHLVIYGTTVPERLWDSLTSDQITDGFLNRFLIFEENNYVLPNDDAESLIIPTSITERLRWWIKDSRAGNLDDENPEPHLVDFTDDAEKRYREHRRSIARKRIAEPKPRASLWSRTAGNTRKLALIFAASRCSVGEMPLANIDDVDHAIAVSNWNTRLLLAKAFGEISDNEFERKLKRAKQVLKNGPISMRNFKRKMVSHTSGRRDIEDLIGFMLDAGIMFRAEEQTQGRPKTMYFDHQHAIEHYGIKN